jgi:UPF0716 protein FxsA
VFVPIALVLIVGSIAEIAVLVAVGQQIGVLPTILLLIGSAALGSWLLRREGTKAWRAFRSALSSGRPPAAEVVDGVLILVGGLAMMLPGFVSDVLGLILVLPPTRRLIRSVVLLQLASRLPAGLIGPVTVRSRRGPAAEPAPPPTPRAAQVLEGQVVEPPDGRPH